MTYLAELKYERILTENMPVRTPSAPIKPVLEDFYLDWMNNYLSIEKFASDYGLEVAVAQKLIDIGRDLFYVPETE